MRWWEPESWPLSKGRSGRQINFTPTSLPSWLVGQYEKSLGLRHYKLGRKGVHKSLYLGLRAEDMGIPYLKGFIRLAKQAEVGRG